MLPGCPTNGPAVSANGDRVAVAWFTAAHGKARVRVAFSRDGGATFGVPQDVDDGAPIGWTGIVFTEDDDAIVSWLEGQPGGGGQVRLRRLREGQRPGPSLVVADTRIGRATGGTTEAEKLASTRRDLARVLTLARQRESEGSRAAGR